MAKRKNISNRVLCEKALQKVFLDESQEFFSYAWREQLDNFIKAESKYSRLIEWINDQIDINLNVIGAFNPADKDKDFTNATMKLYLSACQDIAVLINAREIMLSQNCTTKMRENWEYTLCKLFNIHFNTDLGYVNSEKTARNDPNSRKK